MEMLLLNNNMVKMTKGSGINLAQDVEFISKWKEKECRPCSLILLCLSDHVHFDVSEEKATNNDFDQFTYLYESNYVKCRNPIMLNAGISEHIKSHKQV